MTSFCEGAGDTAPSPPSSEQDAATPKGKSPNQIKQAIKKGQAPKGIERLDNVTIKINSLIFISKIMNQLNKDGAWKDGNEKLTNDQKEWLKSIGCKIPGE